MVIKSKPIPFEFAMDELAPLDPFTKPMFGCTAVYVGEKIVLILREKETEKQDNGVWIATTLEHHESLRKDFPKMHSISVFGPGPTGWQVLPIDDADFEESVLRACHLILEGDVRIGKVPKQKKKKLKLR